MSISESVGTGDAVLADHHREMLAASGITLEHAVLRGYETISDPRRLVMLGIAKAGQRTRGLLVPHHRKDGSVSSYQYRPDHPRERRGKIVKYETPVGQANHIDVPPGVGPMLGDPAIPLWITEGVKKADCGALNGLCIVALPGVWSWRGKNGQGGTVAVGDWNDIALNGRRVIIAFDGDVARKASVRKALDALAAYLKSKGAHVEYLWLADTDDKTGLDDYLADGHTVEDLWRLVNPTAPPLAGEDPPRPPGQADTGERPRRVRLDDAHMSQLVADTTLSGRFCWCASRGWMRYTGKRWERTTDAAVGERVRREFIALHADEARHGADADRLKAISALFAANRIRAVVGLAKGILEVRDDEFDADPDIFNVGNGVVNLKTGQLASHNPKLMLTKCTGVNYRPGATHSDWEKALKALPEESARWMHQRFGQAITGHPTPDDIMPVMQGGGANAKSTWLTAIMRSTGDYSVAVPERVLLANPSDHPTEMMVLRGARLAVLEETPEARHLNVKRLKDTLGSEAMTARHIAKDSVSWSPSHSLILSTNYRPKVDETDHGTWRRLALVTFPFTFRPPGEPLTDESDRKGDPTLRDRLKRGDDGQHEAVQAWLIRGAVEWYRNGRVLPAAPAIVVNDTRAWRADSDAVLGFISEYLVFDTDRWIATADLLAAFNSWLKARGHREWSDQTLAGRLKDHDAWQKATRQKVLASKEGLSRPMWTAGTLGNRPHAWLGVRFRTAADDPDDSENVTDSDVKPQGVQGVQGGPEQKRLALHEDLWSALDTLDTPNGADAVEEVPDGASNGRTTGLSEGAEQIADAEAIVNVVNVLGVSRVVDDTAVGR